MTGARPRHAGLDALRGLLMVAVIIGHFPSSASGSNPFGPLPDWLYYFHVPLFLALSCLFVAPISLALAGQRCRQLLIPYAFWLVLSEPSWLLHPGSLASALAMGNWAHLHSVLWFLPALFSANLLLAGWSRSGAHLRAALILLAVAAFLGAPRLALLHDRIPFGLDLAFYLLPFLLGLRALWRGREALARVMGRWLTVAALAALPLGTWLIRTWEPFKTHSAFARRIDLAQFSVPETVAGYLGMTLLAAGLLVLACQLPAPRWLAAVGRASLPIYLLHYPLLHALSPSIGLAGEARAALLGYGIAVTAGLIGFIMAASAGLNRLSGKFAWIGLSAPRA
jgi:fucose 4-O-acetylase-like acetyltransferase